MLVSRNQLNKNLKNAVFSAMTEFQFLEVLSKDCIKTCREIMAKSTEGVLEIDCTTEDLDRKGLGELCGILRRLICNKQLVKDISNEVKHRNEIAHEACFTYWSNEVNGVSDEELQRKGLEFQKRADVASTLVTRLHKEYKSLCLALEQLTVNSSGYSTAS